MLYSEFVHNLTNSRKIMLAGLMQTRLPDNMIFPHVSELTVYRMDQYSFHHNIRKDRFPNLRVLNYLSTENIDYHVFMDFLPDLIWKTHYIRRHAILDDMLHDSKNIKISNNQYFGLLKDHTHQNETYLRNYIAEIEFRNQITLK